MLAEHTRNSIRRDVGARKVYNLQRQLKPSCLSLANWPAYKKYVDAEASTYPSSQLNPAAIGANEGSTGTVSRLLREEHFQYLDDLSQSNFCCQEELQRFL